MLRRAALLALLLGTATAFFGQSSKPDPWQSIRFLLGSWEGEVQGQPGEGKTEREYHLALHDRYIEVRSKSMYAPQAKNPKGEVHQDWGMISFDRARSRFVLRQFHTEGFVNQYTAGPVQDNVWTFESESIENIPPGFRARETYTVSAPDRFVERFEIAEPGKDYEIYSETKFRRKK